MRVDKKQKEMNIKGSITSKRNEHGGGGGVITRRRYKHHQESEIRWSKKIEHQKK
jgi:hypothetical protein